jgi:hypothetical protein
VTQNAWSTDHLRTQTVQQIKSPRHITDRPPVIENQIVTKTKKLL